MKKRLLSLFLCTCLLLGLFANAAVLGASEVPVQERDLLIQASESQTVTDSPVWVRGIELQKGQYLANGADAAVTEEPTGTGWAYWAEGDDNVLILHNFVGSGDYRHDRYGEDWHGGVICCDDSMIILLEGENTITDAEYGVTFYGVDLIITGDGRFNIHATNAISAEGEMNVEEIVYYPDIGTITLLNTTVDCTSSNGIRAASHVNVLGSSLTVNGYGIHTYGDCNFIGSLINIGKLKSWKCDVYMLGSQVKIGSGIVDAGDIYINSSTYEGSNLKTDYGNLYYTANVVVAEPEGGYIGLRGVCPPYSSYPERGHVVLALTSLTPYTDVVPYAYYEEPVLWAMINGITTGTSATTFSPDANCTRAQVVTFLWRAAGSPAPASTECSFTDAVPGSYYYNAMLWAVENGITTGTGNGKFSPDTNCTRAQVVTFLWRAAEEPAPASTECSFTDVTADSYYYNAMLWAVENGITTGTGSGKFSPDANCTRAQVVTFLYRFMNPPAAPDSSTPDTPDPVDPEAYLGYAWEVTWVSAPDYIGFPPHYTYVNFYDDNTGFLGENGHDHRFQWEFDHKNSDGNYVYTLHFDDGVTGSLTYFPASDTCVLYDTATKAELSMKRQ